VKKFDAAMIRAVKNPDLYPTRYLLATFMSGGYKREIMPLGKKAAA
jgi:hypothetical protein